MDQIWGKAQPPEIMGAFHCSRPFLYYGFICAYFVFLHMVYNEGAEDSSLPLLLVFLYLDISAVSFSSMFCLTSLFYLTAFIV